MESLKLLAVSLGLVTLLLVACAAQAPEQPAELVSDETVSLPTTLPAFTAEAAAPVPSATPRDSGAPATPVPTARPTATWADSSAGRGATVRTLVPELPSATGGLAVDASGNIYAANIGRAPSRNGQEIYRIAPDGSYELWVEGQGLNGASGNSFDAQGNLLQSSLRGGTIHRIAPDGTVTEFVREGLRSPVGIAVTPGGTLFVANCADNTIRRLTPAGESTVFSDSSLLSCPNGITVDDAGNLYVANFFGGAVVRITPAGEAVEFATVPGRNSGHIYFLDGLLYVAARGANQIYTLTLDGELTLLAGTGEAGHMDGPVLRATFSLPNDIVASPDGRRLYVNEALSTDGSTNSPSVIRVIELPPRN